jgi:hypothetical protein
LAKRLFFILITIFWGGVVLAEIAGIAFHAVLETTVVPLVESVAAKLKVLVATDELVGMRRWTVEDVVTATGVEVAESLVSRAARDVALAFGAFRAVSFVKSVGTVLNSVAGVSVWETFQTVATRGMELGTRHFTASALFSVDSCSKERTLADGQALRLQTQIVAFLVAGATAVRSIDSVVS